MKNKKGITLVSLIITIIILLILASVSISLIINSGIITKTKYAVDKYSEGEIEEQIKLAHLEYQTARLTGINKTEEEYMKDSLSNTLNVTVTIIKMGKNYKIEIEGKDKVYILRYDGTIKQSDKIEKMAVTSVYGKLDNENDKILHLKATSVGEYEEIRKNSNNIYDINISYSGIEGIIIDEPIAPTAITFKDCAELIEIENIEDLHTENMISMGNMFYGCKNMESLDVSKFNTENITNLSGMFLSCEKLATLDLSNFDTNKVLNMSGMFRNCKKIEELDLSNFSTENVTNMNYMFYSCNKLYKIDVSSFNTKNVTDMSSMYYGCAFKNINIKNFDTSSVTNMSMMFVSCGNLTELDLSTFDTNKVTNMHQLVGWCSNLDNLNLSGKFKLNDDTNYTNFFNGTVKKSIKIKASDDTKEKLLGSFSDKISESNFI